MVLFYYYFLYSMNSCGRTVENIISTMDKCLLSAVDFPTKRLYAIFDVDVPDYNIVNAIESVGFGGKFEAKYEYDNFIVSHLENKKYYFYI